MNKSKQSSYISDKHLNDCIKIFAANNLSPNVDNIASYMQCNSKNMS